MRKKIAKELFIIILLFIVIIFSLGIMFYDCLVSYDGNIKPILYVTDNEVEEVIKEIKNNEENKLEKDSNSLLKSYTITSSDLNDYASQNNYERGKSNPFLEKEENKLQQ